MRNEINEFIAEHIRNDFVRFSDCSDHLCGREADDYGSILPSAATCLHGRRGQIQHLLFTKRHDTGILRRDASLAMKISSTNGMEEFESDALVGYGRYD